LPKCPKAEDLEVVDNEAALVVGNAAQGVAMPERHTLSI
jgi:hypothetical protein